MNIKNEIQTIKYVDWYDLISGLGIPAEELDLLLESLGQTATWGDANYTLISPRDVSNAAEETAGLLEGDTPDWVHALKERCDILAEERAYINME